MKTLKSNFQHFALYGAVCGAVFGSILSAQGQNKISWSGTMDVYGGLSNTMAHEMPYMRSSARLNEFTLNLAAVDFRYHAPRARSRIVPGIGTFIHPDKAFSSVGFLEATVGIRVLKKKPWWVDMGILTSPLTPETAFSKDRSMYTRSLSSECVPTTFRGIKLSVPLSEKWSSSFYVVEGWQQDENQAFSWALMSQWEWKPTDKWDFHATGFTGVESVLGGSNRGRRWFLDIHSQYKGEGKWSSSSDVSWGRQFIQGFAGPLPLDWSQANTSVEYAFHPKASVAGRLEWMSDPHHLVTSYVQGYPGFRTGSVGLCLNARWVARTLLRADFRAFYAQNDSYPAPGLGKLATWATLSLTVW